MEEIESTTANEATQIVELAEETLKSYIGDSQSKGSALAAANERLPPEVSSHLEAITSKPDSYRDALLVALAIPVVRGKQVDIRERTPGGRTASDRIGRLLRSLHIRGVVGAYQNIGKNSSTLVRGNNEAFDEVLSWGTSASVPEVEIAYRFVVAQVATTARVVAPRPRLRPAQLSFARVMRLFAGLLSKPSGGAHEQYITAALLEAIATQQGDSLRVQTKQLNASDQSSKVSGDVEVLQRGRLQESVEVSAAPWRQKLDQAESSLKSSGLQRAHIIAPVQGGDDYSQLVEASDKDISILDPLATAASFTALLDRRGREFALLRLYELFDEMVADPAIVNSFVASLQDQELADAPGAEG